MYECSSCSNTYAWPQSLYRHFKNKHKDDETVFKDITSPKSSDNSDKEYMDLDESGDDLSESESGDDSTKSESDDDSTESESGDDDNSRKSSTTEDVWDDMILEVYNTEDYATKVSEYEYYQNAEENAEKSAEENAKRDMLEVHTSDLKFNYYKLLLTHHRMQASKMHKKIMAHVKKLHKRYSYRKALRSAIHYRNSMFRRLLEDDISDEETDDDDERTYFEEFSK